MIQDELQQKRLKLQQYKNSELVEGLGWVLDQAINGNITGACFIIKHDRFKHTLGVLGKYRQDPYCAIRASKKLKKLIEKYADDLEDVTDIEYKY
jgi:hypothetical protein